LFLLLLLLGVPCEAQKRAARPKSAEIPAAFPVESIAVEGNRNYSQQQIVGIVGMKVGQVAGPKDFEAARDRLGATGAFESIEMRFRPAASGKGYAVSFRVVEAGPFFAVRFEELGAPAEQLQAVLKRTDPLFGPKIPATQAVLDRYAKALEEFLGKGKVIGKLSSEEGAQLEVVFGPATPPSAVAFVKFTNNQVIPAVTLQNKISGVAVGMPYKEARFRQWLETSVRPLYEARGRIRVSFPEIRTEQAKDVNGLVVTVKVEEGDSYNVGEVRVEGSGIPAEELKKAGDVQPGDLADFDKIQAGVARMEQRHRREGYMKVAARLERKVDDQHKTVDLTVHIEMGPQYVFGKLTVEGLDIYAEAAVRKLWALQEGKRFNAEYPEHFLERVREDEVFENLGKTRAALETNDETRTVDVRLVFQGQGPGRVPARQAQEPAPHMIS